jgi:hypothetical protein
MPHDIAAGNAVAETLRPTTGRYFYWVTVLENHLLRAERRHDPRMSLTHRRLRHPHEG